MPSPTVRKPLERPGAGEGSGIEGTAADAQCMDRIRSLALEVREIDEAWAQESKHFKGERGEVPLRLLSPHDEVETDYARMAWKVATALAREVLG